MVEWASLFQIQGSMGVVKGFGLRVCDLEVWAEGLGQRLLAVT